MKNKLMMSVFLGLCFVTSAGAQGMADGGGQQALPLFSVEHPVQPMMRIRTATKTEVFVNGRVVKTTVTYTAGSTPAYNYEYKGNVTIEQLAFLNRCSTEIRKSEFHPNHSFCADDMGTHYKGIYGKQEFASRFCGQLQTNGVTCAKKVIQLLDAYEAK